MHKRLKRLRSKLEKIGQNYDPSSPSISSSSEHIDNSSNDKTNNNTNTTNTTDSDIVILTCEQVTSDLLITELHRSDTSSIYITTLIDKWSELCLRSETSSFSSFGPFISIILDVQYKLNIANNHNISIKLINSTLLNLFIPYKQPRNLTHMIDEEYTLPYYYINFLDFLVAIHNKTDFPVPFLSTRDVYGAIPMSTAQYSTPGRPDTGGYVSNSNMRDILSKLEGFEFVLVPPFRRGDVWMDLPSLFKLPNVSLILGLRCPGCYLPSPSTTSGTTDDGTNGSLSAQESGYIYLTRHCQQLWLRALTDLSLLLGEHGISLSAASGSGSGSGSGSNKLESAVMLTAAYFIDPTYDKLRNMGISWHSVKAIDFGHYISSYSVYLQRLSSSSSSTCSYVSKVSSKPRVVIYCEEYGNAYWPHWGPSSVNTTGLGGSEEAVYYVSLELAALGYDVEVYADPPDADIYYSNTDNGNSSDNSNTDNSSDNELQSGSQGSVKWLHYSCYNPLSKADVFIAWRYSMSILLGQHCRKRFLWLHDLVGSDLLPMYLTPMVSSHSVYTFFHIHMYTH